MAEHLSPVWGEFLSDLRVFRGFTAEEVDRRAGLPAGTCQAYEKRENAEPWMLAVTRMARLLRVRASELISSTGFSRECVEGRCGPLLRTIRSARGLTLIGAANASGLTPSTYLEIECGSSTMETHAPVLLRLAEALNVPLYDLLAPF